MGLGVEISKLILAFMVLINPFGVLSIYPDLTRNHNTKERRKVTSVAALTVFIVVTVFTLTGSFLLKLLGISIGSFRVGGDVLVLLIAVSMINGNSNPAKPDLGTSEEAEITIQQPKGDQDINAIAMVPIAIPIMVGPGDISTAIIYASAARNYWDTISIIAASPFVSLICYAVLMTSSRINRFLGDTGLTILNHVMGMLLAAVSVEIIVAGLKAIFSQLIS